MNFQGRYLEQNRPQNMVRFFGRDLTNFETQRSNNKNEISGLGKYNQKQAIMGKMNYFSGPALPKDHATKKEVYVPRYIAHKRGKSSFNVDFMNYGQKPVGDVFRLGDQKKTDRHRRTSSLGGGPRDLVNHRYLSNLQHQENRGYGQGWRAQGGIQINKSGYNGVNIMDNKISRLPFSRNNSVQRADNPSPRISVSPGGLNHDSRNHGYPHTSNYGDGANHLYRKYSRPQAGVISHQFEKNSINPIRVSFERPPLNRNSSYQMKQKVGNGLNLMVKCSDTPKMSPQNHIGLGLSSSISQQKRDYITTSQYNVPKPFPNLMNPVHESKKIQNYLGDDLPKLPNHHSNNVMPLQQTSGYNYSVQTSSNQSNAANNIKLNLMSPHSSYKEESFSHQPGSQFKDLHNINLPEIWAHLISEKDNNICQMDYFKIGVQSEVTPRMRGILVDWLIDVHKKFRLRDHTIFITINIIDRALCKINIPKSKFQLLGITALFVASKYEEIYPPPLGEYTYVCADAYKNQDLLQMEADIMDALNFDLVFTSSFNLHQTYATQKNSLRKETLNIGLYMLHLTLLNMGMCRHNSAELVAASYLLSSKLMKEDSINERDLGRDFGVDMKRVKTLAKKLFVFICDEKNSKLTSCKRKFEQGKYKNVSGMKLDMVVDIR